MINKQQKSRGSLAIAVVRSCTKQLNHTLWAGFSISPWLKDKPTDDRTVFAQVNRLASWTSAGRLQLTYANGIEHSKRGGCLNGHLDLHTHLFWPPICLHNQMDPRNKSKGLGMSFAFNLRGRWTTFSHTWSYGNHFYLWMPGKIQKWYISCPQKSFSWKLLSWNTLLQSSTVSSNAWGTLDEESCGEWWGR